MSWLHILLTALSAALLSSPHWTSASETKLIVRPGDNVTLYCDCRQSKARFIVWFRNCSHENQPTLVLSRNFKSSTVELNHFGGLNDLPRFKFVLNESSESYDLWIENVTESDVGRYYCGTEEKTVVDNEKISAQIIQKNCDLVTRLLLNSSSPLDVPLDCSLCSTMLCVLSLTSAIFFFLLSSLLACLLCRKIAKDPQVHQNVTHQNQDTTEVCYAALDVRRAKRRPKKSDQNSDFCTYSAINTSRI